MWITGLQREQALLALHFHYERSAIKSQHALTLELGKPMRRQRPHWLA
jgi:hypothetical protein